MKIRTSNSKAFHKNQDINKIKKNKSLSTLLQKINEYNSQNILNEDKQSINAFKNIISNCYNDKGKQQQLCNLLKLPFVPGPISLNSIPDSFFTQQYLTSQHNRQQNIMNQLNYLFDYLKKTKQYYYCWIIYYHQELKILTVKMMKKFELEENIELLNKQYCLIGIFIDRQTNSNKINQYQDKNQFILSHNQEKRKKMSNKYNSMSYSEKISLQNQQNLSQKSIKNKQSKVKSKIKQRDAIQSFKSNKSQSKTNSSSFQKQNICKVSGDISQFQQTPKRENQFQMQNKKKNFKKKKINLIINAKPIFQENKAKFLIKKIGFQEINNKSLKSGDNFIKKIKSFSRLLSPHTHKHQTIKNVKENNLLKYQIKNSKIYRSISSKVLKEDKDNKQLHLKSILSPQKRKVFKSP